MKIGDLVRHRMDPDESEIGLIVDIDKSSGPPWKAEVLWNIEVPEGVRRAVPKGRLQYRLRHLEVVSEGE